MCEVDNFVPNWVPCGTVSKKIMVRGCSHLPPPKKKIPMFSLINQQGQNPKLRHICQQASLTLLFHPLPHNLTSLFAHLYSHEKKKKTCFSSYQLAWWVFWNEAAHFFSQGYQDVFTFLPDGTKNFYQVAVLIRGFHLILYG